MNTRLYLAMVLASCTIFSDVQAQQFTLSTPGLTSKAYLTDAKLDVIDSQGVVNTYIRDLNFDSADGRWIGYRNKDSGRILRWPSSNSGNLQIGTQQGGQLQYTASRCRFNRFRGNSH